jgi:molybdenum cofactor sulfurtransferase
MIHERVMCLTGWVIEQLTHLRHSNGRSLIQIHGPANTRGRGATVQFNFFDCEGRMWDCGVIEQAANELNISIRTGCHCNPGARELALGFTQDEMSACIVGKEQKTYEQFLKSIQGKTTGAVRVSLGIVANFADVYRFMHFAEGFIDRTIETNSFEFGETVRTLAVT